MEYYGIFSSESLLREVMGHIILHPNEFKRQFKVQRLSLKLGNVK